MKVYLADVDGEYDVFDTERKALDYIIQKKYSGSFYKGINPDCLDDNARRYVVEMKVK